MPVDVALLPYCDEDTAWDCARGLTLGILAASTCTIAAICAYRVGRMFLQTRWYLINLIMLSLASLQCAFMMIKYLLVRDQRLAFAASYTRALQSMLTATIYGHIALESRGRPDLIRRALLPAVVVLTLYLTAIFVHSLFNDVLPCFHPSWLVMSSSQLVIALAFALFGFVAMQEVNSAARVSVELTDVMSGAQQAVLQRRRELWILLLVNTFCAVLQLGADAWLQDMYRRGKDCHVFQTDGEEFLRIVLRVGSYLTPPLATIVVFYWLPRRQFDNALDIQLGGDDDVITGDTPFELVPTTPQPDRTDIGGTPRSPMDGSGTSQPMSVFLDDADRDIYMNTDTDIVEL